MEINTIGSTEMDEIKEAPPPDEINMSVWHDEVGGKFSLERAQEMVEDVHKRALEQILETNEKWMSEDDLERISKGTSLEAVDYTEGSENIGAFLYNEGMSHIRVCAIDEEQIERTTQHETNHFTSFNREIRIRHEDGGSMRVYKTSGIHVIDYVENREHSIIEVDDKNRGFNEGITQMFTNRQLDAIDPEKGLMARRQNGYGIATELVEQVEQLVGEETVSRAYYGGDVELLKEKMDALGGEGTFERISKNIDVATYSRDYSKRIMAVRDTQEVLAGMAEV